MKKIIDYFVDHSVVVNLLTILIVVLGVFSIATLNKETFPNVDFNYINIRITYPGSAAEDVEKLVTIEVERQLQEVDGIEEMNAMSAEGAAIISLKVDPDYEVDDVLDETRNALSDIESQIPNDADAPIITKATNSRRGIIEFAIFGDDELKLRAKVKTIRDVLERDKRIVEAKLNGYRDEIFEIQVRENALSKYDMTLTEILSAVKDRQVNISAGNIKSPVAEKLVRTLKENESVASLEQIVLRSNDTGNKVLLKDVALVGRSLKEDQIEYRGDGKFAIFISVKAKSSADVVDTADFVKAKMNNLSKLYDFKYKEYQDLSFYVKRRLGVLSQNGIQGIILVVLCLMMFMNLRVSIITALGAPFAFFVAFTMMDSLGITINLISMFGLILVLGMLVDDSIIVAEQYYQYLEKGMKPKEAAKKAAMATVAPITSTVITTMIAFGSLFFMTGIMGKFLWPVPAVVILCLIASWFECFIILPGHLADFASKVKNAEKTRWYQPLLNFYKKTLEVALKYSKSTIVIFVVAFIVSIMTAFSMRFELFPADDVTYISVKIKGPVGTPQKVTEKIITNLENVINDNLKENELIGYKTLIGYQHSKNGTPRSGGHYGSIILEVSPQEERERSTDQLIKDVTREGKKVTPKEYVFSFEKEAGGPPRGKAVNVELSSDSLKDLIAASDMVKKHMDSEEGYIGPEVDYEKGKKQIIIDINEAEARRLGVSNLAIAREVRSAYEGLIATTIKKSKEDIDVVIRLERSARESEETLKKLRVTNAQGRRILISRLAKFYEVDGAYVIRRFEQRRTISVASEIDRLKTTSSAQNKKIKPYLDRIVKQYPDMTYLLTGENKNTADSLDSFKKALIASVFIIFILLVVQFSSMAQPIIIMSAIPFALIGVVISFKIFGMPIGFMALMGMLGLVGVVINDSIVLVTFINRTLQEEGFHVASIVKASISRFRPVILTTFTTVVGLLPIAHMPGGDPFLKPMATSFAYGLLFSTTLTLIFVPCCYLIYVRLLERFNKLPHMD